MKKIKIVVIVIVALIGLYFLPLFAIDVNANGKTYRVPVFSFFQSQNENSITFASVRSAYALGKDGENALHHFEEVRCYGQDYFYDASSDHTYEKISLKSGLLNQIIFHYQQGNTCKGWTTDDEIAWPFQDIKTVVGLTRRQVVEKEYFVIGNPNENVGKYRDFSRFAKQGVLSYLRTYIENENRWIDIQLLEDGKFKVTTLEQDGKVETTLYARFSEEIEGNLIKVLMYKSSYLEEKPVELFQFEA